MKKTQDSAGESFRTYKNDNPSLRKIFPFFYHYRGLLVAASSTYILMNLIGLAMPWMLKISLDKVLPNADYVLFALLCGVMAIIYLVRFLLRYIANYLTDYAGIRLIVDVRQKIFRHLQSLSLRFYEEYRTGKLISNVISDVGLLNGLMRLWGQLAEQTFQLVLIAILLLFINWQMALAVFLTIPLHFLNFRFFHGKIRRDAMQKQEQISMISSTLSETLSGVKVVKAFARENAESLRFFRTQKPIIDSQMRQTVHMVYLVSVTDILTVITYLATIGFGIRYIQTNALTIGEFVAFYTYVGMILGPVSVLSNLTLSFAEGLVGAARVIRLLDTLPDIKEAANPIHPQDLKGDIEFKDVCFTYRDLNAPTIRNFNLRILPGEKVALVGPSGSGKSTITNLLLRFYDISSGSITMDGFDIRRFAFEPYRKQIGIVLQEPFLFSGTIRENIGYARNDATDEEIENAARLANVEEFVMKLPDGYETIIGENGASLSGGQKQRLAIARAILNNPSILVLDEATSALDTVSESLVQEALDRLMKGKTTIIIAHRLSTIQNADKIIVLDRGKVVQSGKHEELLMQNGIYRELYQKQKKMAAGN